MGASNTSNDYTDEETDYYENDEEESTTRRSFIDDWINRNDGETNEDESSSSRFPPFTLPDRSHISGITDPTNETLPENDATDSENGSDISESESIDETIV